MELTRLTDAPALAEVAARSQQPLDTLVKAWLVSYRNDRTRESYAINIRQWLAFCAEHGVPPIQPLRSHVELWMRLLERAGMKPRTVAQRVNVLASFLRYLLDEDVIQRDPMRGVKRPRIERQSPTGYLRRSQAADLLTASIDLGPHPAALLHILTLNGLRIAEACSLDVGSLVWDGRYPQLQFTRKGGKGGRAYLSRETEPLVLAAIGDRTSGPLLLNAAGNRMRRANAQPIIDKAMRSVRGHHPRITPHALRHTWATLCLEAGVPVQQVQYDGGWADGRLVAYYTHGQDSGVKAATNLMSPYVYSAA